MFQIAGIIKQAAVSAWNSISNSALGNKGEFSGRSKRKRPQSWEDDNIISELVNEDSTEECQDIPLNKRPKYYTPSHESEERPFPDTTAESFIQDDFRRHRTDLWSYVVGRTAIPRRYSIGKRLSGKMPRRHDSESQRLAKSVSGEHVGSYSTLKEKESSTESRPAKENPLFGRRPRRTRGDNYSRLNDSQASNLLQSHPVPVYDNLGYVRSPARRTGISTVENVVRLEERKRYKQLLKHFTTVVLADESDAAENGVTTPSLLTSSRSSKVEEVIGVFQDSVVREAKDARGPYDARKYASHNLLTVANSTKRTVTAPPSQDVVDVDVIKTDESSVPGTSCNEDILGSEWISKWRETLDPVNLARQREIAKLEEDVEKLRTERFEGDISSVLKQRIKDEVDEDPGLRPLSIEEQQQIDDVMAVRNPTQTISETTTASITRGDLNTLTNLTWLNDEAINFFFQLMKERSTSEKGIPAIHTFNTFFYQKLLKAKYAGVRRWTKKVDLFSLDLVLIPVHLGVHWCLACIDFKQKKISYYDSMKGNNSKCLQELRQYIESESQDKKKVAFDFTGWQMVTPKDIPEQMNGCDCGVFACKYAECLSRGAKFTFSQNDMPLIRQRIILSIINKKIT